MGLIKGIDGRGRGVIFFLWGELIWTNLWCSLTCYPSLKKTKSPSFNSNSWSCSLKKIIFEEGNSSSAILFVSSHTSTSNVTLSLGLNAFKKDFYSLILYTIPMLIDVIGLWNLQWLHTILQHNIFLCPNSNNTWSILTIFRNNTWIIFSLVDLFSSEWGFSLH